jgi:hypothetical protein
MTTQYQTLQAAISQAKADFRQIAKDSKNFTSINYSALLSPENYSNLVVLNQFLFGNDAKIQTTILAIESNDFQSFLMLKANA